MRQIDIATVVLRIVILIFGSMFIAGIITGMRIAYQKEMENFWNNFWNAYPDDLQKTMTLTVIGFVIFAIVKDDYMFKTLSSPDLLHN